MSSEIIPIEEKISNLKDEICEIADKVGRNQSDIKLVAVTKYSEIDDIKLAYEAGLLNFGENRVQNALSKLDKLPKDIIWHMIGHLQRNKVRFVLGNFSLIHAVDSKRLAQEINNRANQLDITQDILIEINISGENSKFGLNVQNAHELVEEILEMQNINLIGLMTMAPFVAEERIIRDTFVGLRNLRDKLQDDQLNHKLL